MLNNHLLFFVINLNPFVSNWIKQIVFTDKVVQRYWEGCNFNGDDIWVLKEKLKSLKSALKLWNREVFGDMNYKKQKIITEISKLDIEDEYGNLSLAGRLERNKLLAELRLVVYQLEVQAKQKSRAKWMAEGDLNTRYFHQINKWRRIKNNFRGLHMAHGWCEEPTIVKEGICNQFKDKFSEKSSLLLSWTILNSLELMQVL